MENKDSLLDITFSLICGLILPYTFYKIYKTPCVVIDGIDMNKVEEIIYKNNENCQQLKAYKSECPFCYNNKK